MPTQGPRARSPRAAAIFLEASLWVFSVGAFGVVGFNLIDSKLYQHRADAQLEALAARPAETAVQPALPDEPAAVPVLEEPLFSGQIPEGAPIARLEIPRLGISAVVAEGEQPSTLRRAVGHLSQTPLPGQPGNVALAAHRDTFFRGLDEIRPGDVVVLDSGARRHRYVVAWTEVVDPWQVEVTKPTPEPSLTLITCYPFRWIGPAPRRFVVRALLELGDGEAWVAQGPATTTAAARESGP
jgi:LPXTG-site transpeptidase (sortase) family protein